MIAFKVGDEFLDMPDDFTLSIEEQNSLFNTDYIPGLLTYPVTAPPTPKNNRLLGFPLLLNKIEASGKKEIDASCYLYGMLYRSGKINVLPSNNRGIAFNFQSGAGAVTGKDISLQSINLGTDTLSYQTADIYPDANYILAPIKNGTFYDTKNPDYKGYINYYEGSFKTNTTTNDYAVVPFPFLSYIFRKVMAHFGYTVLTGWLDTPAIAKLFIYNTYALDKLSGSLNIYETAIDFKNHVPDMKAAEFLKAVRSRFFLDYHFDTKAKTLEIIPLRDIINDQQYLDFTEKIESDYDTAPNNTDGFTLEMALDSGDDLTKSDTTTWNRYIIGNGTDPITTAISTLEMYRGQDSITPARSWLIPEAKQKGSSILFDLGTNKCGLRLLSYLGMQPDSVGNDYPLASWDVINYDGDTVEDTEGLRWDGATGIYQTYAKDWLDFRAATRSIDRSVRLSIVDLLTLNHARKWLSRGSEGTVKMIYEKLSFSISNKNGIKPTKGSFFKVNL